MVEAPPTGWCLKCLKLPKLEFNKPQNNCHVKVYGGQPRKLQPYIANKRLWKNVERWKNSLPHGEAHQMIIQHQVVRKVCVCVCVLKKLCICAYIHTYIFMCMYICKNNKEGMIIQRERSIGGNRRRKGKGKY